MIVMPHTQLGMNTSKVLFLQVQSPVKDYYPIVAAGNMYIGTKDAFIQLYDDFYKTLWFMSNKSISVGSDQHVLCYTCYYYQDSCQFFYPGILKRWFAFHNSFKKGPRLVSTKMKIRTKESWIHVFKRDKNPPNFTDFFYSTNRCCFYASANPRSCIKYSHFSNRYHIWMVMITKSIH